MAPTQRPIKEPAGVIHQLPRHAGLRTGEPSMAQKLTLSRRNCSSTSHTWGNGTYRNASILLTNTHSCFSASLRWGEETMRTEGESGKANQPHSG